MTGRALAAVAAMTVLATAGGPALEARPAAAAALPGFTAQEAEAGARIYAGACAMCHGKDLAGTYEVPPLTGRFVANWSHVPARDLHAYLRKAMPLFAPDSLSDEDATRVLAYLLRSNDLVLKPAPAPRKGADPRLEAVIAPGPARVR